MLTAETGIKVLYDVADASWKPDDRAVCNIIISAGHIVMTVFDPSKKRFVSLYCAEVHTENEKSDLIASRLSNNYPGIQNHFFFISVPKTMLIPSALFDKENRDPFLEKQHKADIDDLASDYPVKLIGAQMAFLYPKTLELLKNNTISSHQLFIPLDAAWLDGLYLNYKNNDEIHLHLNVNDGFISIAVFRNGALQFYNTFDTANAEEVLYFVMFVSEQLHVNTNKDSYFYSGFIKKTDETFALLSKYIKLLKPEERPGFYNYSMPILDVPIHMFFNTFCTPICES